jgi:hypothetical protein
MKTLRSIAGYSWAFLALFITLATFMGSPYFSRKLASASGVTISPWFSGGEVAAIRDHGSYTTKIRRPVFDGLISERKSGFVQIDWESEGALPAEIEERIDHNSDKAHDFTIRLNTSTGKVQLTAYDSSVKSVERVYRIKKGWAVRVLLRKQQG